MRGPALAVLLGLALAAPRAAAQVELDGSIGPTSGLVPGGTLPDGTSATYLIEDSYGLRSGRNLFHSFSRFSIPSASSAAFTGNASIERVIGRVTGNLPSLIDGTLRSTIEGADLYLFNPVGIFFSGTASLDLRGSLYLSSANNLRFEDGSVLPTIPASGEVLSAEPPSAWGFTAVTALRIISFTRARGLQVPRGETLSVVGGPVAVSGVATSTTLLAPGGTIAIASRLAPGEVPVNVADLPARGAAAGEFGAINIGANTSLDVSDPSDLSPTRGRVVIRGGSLAVVSASLRSDSAVDAEADTPDFDLETSTSISLSRSSTALPLTTLEVAARGDALGGGLRLSSELVSLSGASIARTIASDSAIAGSLEVDAGSLHLSETSRLSASAAGDATAGRISLNATTIDLTTGAQINSVNEASTNASEIEISSLDMLRIESGARVATQALADGRGATVRIEGGTLEQATGAKIESGTTGAGAGGDLEIHTRNVDLRGEAQGSDPGGLSTSSFGSGAAGDIVINADDLIVVGGAQISATAEGAGRGGDIDIEATRALELSGASLVGPSGVFARSGFAVGTGVTGHGGNIFVEAPVVAVIDGGEISTQTFGEGTAGGIQILAAERVRVAGSATTRSSVNARTSSSGTGGNIEIETRELLIDDGGEVSASALSTGDSGDIRIEAESVHVGGGAPGEAGSAGIFAQSIKDQTETIAAGAAGDIEIVASRLLELRRSARISVNTASSKPAGSIRIVAPDVIVADGASISAQTGTPVDITASGKGGDIEIVAANSVDLRSAGSISVRTLGPGDAGQIAIRGAEAVTIEDAEISAFSDSRGAAGEVILDDIGALSIADGGKITTQTLQNGVGGSITIDARREVVLGPGGEISARTQGSGSAGAVTIRNADRVSLEGGGITARSEGTGAAGSVTLDGVGELIVGAGGSITTETLADGPGGSIAIDADSQVLVMNGGTISALSTGTGDAGSITIDAGQRFSARNGGQVTTSAVLADGGDIDIKASRLIYIEDGKITTDVRAGLGSGGNITLDPEFVVLNRAELRASATGDGGNITIQTDRFVRDASSIVDASSEFGVDGEIQTTSPTVDLTSELAQLDTTFLDASSKLAAACAARSGDHGTFAVRGRQHPSSPDAPLDSEAPSASPLDCRQSRSQP